MKKIILISIFFFIFSPVVESQDLAETFKLKEPKLNPDGYIGGVTFKIEPGFDYVGNAEYKENLGSSSATQDLTIKNPFLKLNVLFPLAENSTFFLTTTVNWFKEKGIENDYFWGWETHYTRFSISGGFNFYLKSIFR